MAHWRRTLAANGSVSFRSSSSKLLMHRSSGRFSIRKTRQKNLYISTGMRPVHTTIVIASATVYTDTQYRIDIEKDNYMDEKETGRLEAFSDGVFAVAITLLVLNIKIPAIDVPSSQLPGDADLWHALGGEWSMLAAYVT